ncbi:hypothetical protein GCM10011391_17450 [Pullulanibacillus camelliae]|uniref:Spore germination protein GerPE n=1 Tax=Pullulanibacillus camelliae TaxID=1707096 RepID=A0A8J2VVW0_9BACL|nr:spore germination protein GerPE [Pullulanibacillus camelliae]GGE39169.1 hypothetical protein GCM10011391_17450 [Pullulanibacillus camelliae]
MEPRTSKVDRLFIRNISLSSCCEIGDTHTLAPENDAYAIQRQLPIFLGSEGKFSDYDTFYTPLLVTNVYEPIQTAFVNDEPIINVSTVKITSVSAASIIQVGSTATIDAQFRGINIRNYLRTPNE